MTWHTWRYPDSEQWPFEYPKEKVRGHELDEIVRWMRVFLNHFFEMTKFKLSTLPNRPKISLSRLGHWRRPSNNSAEIWLDELDSWVED